MSALFFPAHGWFEAAWDLAFCSIGFGRFRLDYATFLWERQRHGIAAVASTMTISQLVHQGSGNNITSPTILVRGLWNLSNIRDIHIGLRWKNSRCATCRDSAGQGTENEAAGSHHKGDEPRLLTTRHVLCWLLQLWVMEIKEAGHDLVAYGRAEMAAFEKTNLRPTSRLKGCYLQDGIQCSRYFRYKLKGFKYGANPEEWDVLLERLPVGERKVKQQSTQMPGSWVEYDSDMDSDEFEEKEEEEEEEKADEVKVDQVAEEVRDDDMRDAGNVKDEDKQEWFVMMPCINVSR